MTKITVDIFKKDMAKHPTDFDQKRAERLGIRLREVFYYRKLLGYPRRPRYKINLNELKKDIEKNPNTSLEERANIFEASIASMFQAEKRVGYRRKRISICVKIKEED